MREIDLRINKEEFKEKLGIKDVDMTPILESIASLKKELKKTPNSSNKEVLDALKLITNKKSDNSDIISAINKMASKIVVPEGNNDLILRFDKLVDALNSQGLFRPNYNSYNPQLRNKEGVEINPATEEKQDAIIAALGNVKIDTGDIELNTDGLEGLLTDVITNQDDVTATNIHTNNKELRVYQENHICNDNTTTTPLLANATYTGNWQDCLQYQEVDISIDSDQNSATNGFIIQWSADAINVADTDVFTVYANAGTNYTPNPAFRYVRVVYTNGSTPQTRFSLMTILRRGVTGGSFHRIDSTLKDDSDGRLNLSVIKLRTAQNNYVSGAATNAGNFKTSIEEIEPTVNIASKTNQLSQIALEETLNSLIGTLQELTARLDVLAGMANSGQPALRTIPIASVSTAVTGSLTTVTNLTNFGTGYPALEVSHDINNSTAILANIQNVVLS